MAPGAGVVVGVLVIVAVAVTAAVPVVLRVVAVVAAVIVAVGCKTTSSISNKNDRSNYTGHPLQPEATPWRQSSSDLATYEIAVS